MGTALRYLKVGQPVKHMVGSKSTAVLPRELADKITRTRIHLAATRMSIISTIGGVLQ